MGVVSGVTDELQRNQLIGGQPIIRIQPRNPTLQQQELESLGYLVKGAACMKDGKLIVAGDNKRFQMIQYGDMPALEESVYSQSPLSQVGTKVSIQELRAYAYTLPEGNEKKAINGLVDALGAEQPNFKESAQLAEDVLKALPDDKKFKSLKTSLDALAAPKKDMENIAEYLGKPIVQQATLIASMDSIQPALAIASHLAQEPTQDKKVMICGSIDKASQLVIDASGVAATSGTHGMYIQGAQVPSALDTPEIAARIAKAQNGVRAKDAQLEQVSSDVKKLAQTGEVQRLVNEFTASQPRVAAPTVEPDTLTRQDGQRKK